MRLVSIAVFKQSTGSCLYSEIHKKVRRVCGWAKWCWRLHQMSKMQAASEKEKIWFKALKTSLFHSQYLRSDGCRIFLLKVLLNIVIFLNRNTEKLIGILMLL